MKVGIIVTNTYRDLSALTAVSLPEMMEFKAPRRSYFDKALGQESMRLALRLAREIDELGFDHISVSEHHFMPYVCAPNAALLAAQLSQVVRKASVAWLGPIVSVNNPLRIAEEIAMLDQMTGGGRLIVYLNKGTPNEHLTYGFEPDDARARGQEASLLIKKALSEPEPFAWDGKYWKFPLISVWPGSSTQPHPLLYTSGSGQETVDFAAQNGFGIAVAGIPQHIGAMPALYRESCERAGFTPSADHVLTRGTLAVGESDAHAEDLLRRMLPSPDLAAHAESIGTSTPREEPSESHDTGARPFFPVLLQGSPSTVIDQARELAGQGIGVLDLVPDFGGLPFEDISDMVHRLGTEVLPQIREF